VEPVAVRRHHEPVRARRRRVRHLPAGVVGAVFDGPEQLEAEVVGDGSPAVVPALERHESPVEGPVSTVRSASPAEVRPLQAVDVPRLRGDLPGGGARVEDARAEPHAVSGVEEVWSGRRPSVDQPAREVRQPFLQQVRRQPAEQRRAALVVLAVVLLGRRK
jgi:hypothetical protein